MITLSITPLRKLLGRPQLIRFRRMLELFVFFYGCLHFATYVWLDKFFDVSDMIKDVGKRPFVTAGFTGFVLAGSFGLNVYGRLDPSPRGASAGRGCIASFTSPPSPESCTITGW